MAERRGEITKLAALSTSAVPTDVRTETLPIQCVGTNLKNEIDYCHHTVVSNYSDSENQLSRMRGLFRERPG